MNQTRRKLMKMLPLAAVAGVAVKAGERNVRAVEVKPSKRYVLKVDADLTQAGLNHMRTRLTEPGYPDMLVIAGPCELYELG